MLDGGVAHCHISCDDGDEEELHKDGAIRLLLERQTDLLAVRASLNNNACVFTV